MKELALLKNIMAEYDSAIVAFSGGVDSAFLACMAGEYLKNILLVTGVSPIHPPFELKEAKSLAQSMNLDHRIITTEELSLPEFFNNSSDRCYYCKRELFMKIKNLAIKENYEVVFDGSNADDEHDYRPGRRSLLELSVRSPLAEAGLTKSQIRDLSQRAGLPTAGKASSPCLASRIPYGERITESKLARINRVEEALLKTGFTQLRVRSHGDVARIEFIQDEIEMGWAKRKLVQNICKKAGFIYVAIDTEGYRMGAMNEVL